MDVFPASDASEHDSSSSSCEESGYGADEQGDAGLTVVGYACRVFRDDATAQWIDSNEHLVRWGNELVDRFDVRCLLDPDAVFARREDAEACEEGLSPKQRERLQRERYKDLLRIEQRSAQAEAKRKEEARGVGFAVADSESKAQDAQQDAAKATNNMFTSSLPSHREGVPKRLDVLLAAEIPRPRNQKVHDVILATARRVRQTPQLKVLLQLRMQDSPAFQFLDEGSEIHAYYSFLVNADDATFRSIEGCKWHEREPDIARQVLSASYFDNSDDDDGEDLKERKLVERQNSDGKEGVEKEEHRQEEAEQAMELSEQQDTHAAEGEAEAEATQQQQTEPAQQQAAEYEDWADVQALLDQQQWHSNMYGDLDFDVDYARYAQADGGHQPDPQQRLKRARMLQGHFKLKLMHEGAAVESNRVAGSPSQHQTPPQTVETQQQAAQGVADVPPSVQRSAIDYKRVRRRIQEILADLQC